MDNKPMERVPINKQHFIEELERQNSSIRKLGSEDAYPIIQRDERTIRRYLDKGEMPLDLLNRIAKYLNVHPDLLTGSLHEKADIVENEYLRELSKSFLTAEHYPYILKAKTDIEYAKYFEDILTMNDITIELFRSLPPEERVIFHQELAVAILRVIAKHFPTDSLGRSTSDELQYYESIVNEVNPLTAFTELEGIKEPEEPDFEYDDNI